MVFGFSSPGGIKNQQSEPLDFAFRNLQDALKSLPEEVMEEASQAPSFEDGSLVLG